MPLKEVMMMSAKKQPNELSENDIEQYLFNSAEKYNALCYKFISPMNSGVPDRIVILNGWTVFVELKAPGKKPRKLQEKVIEKMRKRHASVYVIDSKELVDELFNDILSARKRKSLNHFK